MLPPATSAEIKQQHVAIKAIDPSWELHMTTQVELAKCSLLQEYFKTHVREQHKYLYIVGKCGNSDCKFNCSPLRMPRASFGWLSSRPHIVLFPMHRASSGRDHFAPNDKSAACLSRRRTTALASSHRAAAGAARRRRRAWWSSASSTSMGRRPTLYVNLEWPTRGLSRPPHSIFRDF